jgi:hypothetical protein
LQTCTLSHVSSSLPAIVAWGQLIPPCQGTHACTVASCIGHNKHSVILDQGLMTGLCSPLSRHSWASKMARCRVFGFDPARFISSKNLVRDIEVQDILYDLVVIRGWLQRDAKEIRRKGKETKQETERHTHRTEPTSQPRPTQNTMEAAKATQEHEPTGTKKRNNHTRHKPEIARPQRPPAQTPNRNRQQRHKTAYQGQKRGRRAQAGRGGIRGYYCTCRWPQVARV